MALEFEDQYKQFIKSNTAETPVKQMFVVRFLLKHRFVKTERQANKIVTSFFLTVSVISILFALWYVHVANIERQVKYEISSDVLRLLPEEIQIKILQQ